MRVVLTGSSGFVGTALLQLFREKQIEVMTIPHHQLYGMGQDELVVGELARNLRKFQPDTFIHLAWRVEATSWWNAEPQKLLITSTKVLLNLLNDCGISQTIGVGTCLEYFPSPTCIDERGKENTDFEYTRDKLEMKRVLADHATQNGYTSTWARFFFLYGPNDRAERLIPSLTHKAALNLDIYLDNPNAVVDYLNVKDAAEALFVLAQSRSGGVYNVGSGIPVTPLEVAVELIRLTKSRSKITTLPQVAKELNGFVANTSKMNVLNWVPRVSFEEGLRFLIGIDGRN